MLKKRNNLTNIRRNSNKNKTKKNVEKIVKKKSSNNVKRNVKNNVKKVVKKKSSNNVKRNVKRITKHKKKVKKKNSNKKTRKMVGGGRGRFNPIKGQGSKTSRKKISPTSQGERYVNEIEKRLLEGHPLPERRPISNEEHVKLLLESGRIPNVQNVGNLYHPTEDRLLYDYELEAMGKAIGNISEQAPFEMSSVQEIIAEINRNFNEIVNDFNPPNKVPIQYSVEEGHNDLRYYLNTLRHINHFRGRFPILLNTFFYTTSQLTDSEKILVIDGENKLNHNLGHIQQAIGRAGIQNFVNHLITIFNEYTKIFIIYKTDVVDTLLDNIIGNKRDLEQKIVKLSFADDGFRGSSSLDDLLVVYIVKYLQSILSYKQDVYNTNMGFGNHTAEAFCSSPEYITKYNRFVNKILTTAKDPKTFYEKPDDLPPKLNGQLPQLSVATGDKYIFI